MDAKPLYTPETCPQPAYQLNWSYSIFWHGKPIQAGWLETLKEQTLKDGIKIRNHHAQDDKTSQFFISTKPYVAPKLIVQRVKGRLQTILRPKCTNAFRRNYALRSIGLADRVRTDAYLAKQLNHHPLADPKTLAQFRQYQFEDPTVDLSCPRRTAHAIYWHNLHIVLVNTERYRDINHQRMSRRLETIKAVSRKKTHSLRRVAILPDHLHFTDQANLDEAPADVVFAYMNNRIILPPR